MNLRRSEQFPALTFTPPPSIYRSPGTSGLLALHIALLLAAKMTERSSHGLDERRRRLLFRAWRRGVREMDLIVGRFADAYIDQFDTPALDEFERLIEVPNAELYGWIVGGESVPANQDSAVLRQLIAFHNRRGAER
jgi:antitoxin CptB